MLLYNSVICSSRRGGVGQSNNDLQGSQGRSGDKKGGAFGKQNSVNVDSENEELSAILNSFIMGNNFIMRFSSGIGGAGAGKH